MQALLVRKPGTFTTIQDAGRPGMRRYGIPTSGAMDMLSFRIANALVGNPSDAAAIEVTLQGFIVEALAPVVIAITGGDLGAHHNDHPAKLWESLTLEYGDRLSFLKHSSGCRAYVAIRGGIDAPAFLGSKSTFAKGRMGASLKSDDILSIDHLPHPTVIRRRWFPPHLRPALPAEQTIRVILGPQTEYFTQRGIETFLQSSYMISPKSDRQGFRTEGPSVEIAKGPDIISDPTPLGAIQIPGDGKPIILHRDGQTTGGYAKIAKVIEADLDKFGQLVPGDRVCFRAVSREEAVTLFYKYRYWFSGRDNRSLARSLFVG